MAPFVRPFGHDQDAALDLGRPGARDIPRSTAAVASQSAGAAARSAACRRTAADRAKPGSGDGESRKSGEPEAGTLTLKGCLQRVGSSKAFRLHPIEGDDATVTADVRLGGDVEQLRDHVGRIVEVRGIYEQDTPATTTPSSFSVSRVKALTGTCPAR